MSKMIAAGQDERETAKVDTCVGYEDYAHWVRMRQQDTAAFHLEYYGERVNAERETVRCAQ